MAKNNHGMKMAGIMLATFIGLISRKLNPNAAIKRPPTADISVMISCVMRLFTKDAPNAIAPSYINTGRDENITPIPMAEEKIMEANPSRTDFASRTE